ncbi:MAG: hypothetical protein EOL95_00725 [Bacteroidia bacterium]|nr:hypothetical protein [Bacteroidia bacterium]
MKKLNIICLIKVLCAFCFAICFTSCESRVDLFHTLNKSPKICLSEGLRDFSDSLQNINLIIRHGEEKIVYFDYEDDFLGNESAVTYAVLNIQGTQDYISYELYPEAGRLVIKDILPTATLLDKIVKMTITVYVSDYYGDKGEAVINLLSCDNEPPIPNIKLTLIKDMEYVVSSDQTIDPDGDNVVAYEYLFDGTIDFDKPGYEIETQMSVSPNPGMAASEGTYIIATPLSSVKYAFQSAGTHIIAMRAKDALGLWSKWSTIVVDL